MFCETKYRPVVNSMPENELKTFLTAYLMGDGFCPSCKEEGRESIIEERFGETT